MPLLGASAARPTPPSLSSKGGSNLILCATRSEPPSVLRVRDDCGSRLFTPKFGVVVHNLAHQPPQSLADGRRHPAGSSVLRLSSRSHQLLHLLQRYRLWLSLPRGTRLSADPRGDQTSFAA